jgi:hypothetical protein
MLPQEQPSLGEEMSRLWMLAATPPVGFALEQAGGKTTGATLG